MTYEEMSAKQQAAFKLVGDLGSIQVGLTDLLDLEFEQLREQGIFTMYNVRRGGPEVILQLDEGGRALYDQHFPPVVEPEPAPEAIPVRIV